MTDEEKIREFLAKRGATKIPEGQSALPPKGRQVETVRLIHTDHLGRQWTTNEHGETVFLG